MKRQDIKNLIPEECEELMIPIMDDILSDIESDFKEIESLLSDVSVTTMDRVEEAYLKAGECATDLY